MGFCMGLPIPRKFTLPCILGKKRGETLDEKKKKDWFLTDLGAFWFVSKDKVSVHVSGLKCWYNLFKYLNTNHICNQVSHGWGFLSYFGNTQLTVPERQDKGPDNKQTYWNVSRNDREEAKLVTLLHWLVHSALPLGNLCLLFNTSGFFHRVSLF